MHVSNVHAYIRTDICTRVCVCVRVCRCVCGCVLVCIHIRVDPFLTTMYEFMCTCTDEPIEVSAWWDLPNILRVGVDDSSRA